MNKEQARFILRCFRPDETDAEFPEFNEALALAAKDRELGEWLACERSMDSVFARALESVAIPCILRQELVIGMVCTVRFGRRPRFLSGAWWKRCWPASPGNRRTNSPSPGLTRGVRLSRRERDRYSEAAPINNPTGPSP
jgi:hypothetical protein